MRPSILNPLFSPATGLAGVGPKVAGLLARLVESDPETGVTVGDLLWHLPTGFVDRRWRPPVVEARPGIVATILLTVDRHRPTPPGSRAPYRVHCHDETGELTLVFFNARSSWLERNLPVGERRWVSGRVEMFADALQMVHPDHIVDDAGLATLPAVEPVYPRTEGLGPRAIQKAVESALALVPDMPEWQDPAWLERQDWPDFRASLETVHRPDDPDASGPASAAWQRLSYDEFLAGQLALRIVRGRMRRGRGIARRGDGRFADRIVAALPFSLTGSQRDALAEIRDELGASERMLRLLQGDVGSGKTIVGLLAMATVAEAGAQAAMMAPTELLARQHHRSIMSLAEAAGLRVALLTGREKGRERSQTLATVQAGEIDILVGTHALFQAGVEFRDLGLAIIDEQHRFGVHHRLALAAKGEAVDMLVMTATPIPRTLMITHYGDMDVSRLTEKPAGRKPIETRVVSADRIEDLVAGIARALGDGAQVYWVCPLVEESETVDLMSAEQRHAMLYEAFGDIVGLVHGRMAGRDKDAVMARFVAGELRVLVATTVIEVGVDVPDANIMVIEHAERFGLAQLHQLRGRVGRGARASSCVLAYSPPLGEVARARLAIMRESEDGFLIAEEDLRLRGGGEVLGTRQSGMPGFRIARAELHLGLLEAARDDARLVLERDPALQSPRGQALRTLLYLFRQDTAVRLVSAG